MTINIPVEVSFDSIADILDDLDKLQTYKLYEGSDELLVTKADVCDVLARHLVVQEMRGEQDEDR